MQLRKNSIICQKIDICFPPPALGKNLFISQSCDCIVQNHHKVLSGWWVVSWSSHSLEVHIMELRQQMGRWDHQPIRIRCYLSNSSTWDFFHLISKESDPRKGREAWRNKHTFHYIILSFPFRISRGVDLGFHLAVHTEVQPRARLVTQSLHLELDTTHTLGPGNGQLVSLGDSHCHTLSLHSDIIL